MEIKKGLEKLGLNNKEITVYLALLATGRATPAELAKQTKINRATVYNLVKSLMAKEMVVEEVGKKTLQVIPLPPEGLRKLADQPRKELAEKEAVIGDVIEELNKIASGKNYPVPKIRFVEENGLRAFLDDNTAKWVNSIDESDGIWWGFQDHSFVEQYGDWVVWFWNKYPEMKLQSLSNASQIEQKFKGRFPGRNIKFAPGMNFTSTLWVNGEFLVMIFTRARPFYLFEIHDVELARNMREVFKRLWNLQ